MWTVNAHHSWWSGSRDCSYFSPLSPLSQSTPSHLSHYFTPPSLFRSLDFWYIKTLCHCLLFPHTSLSVLPLLFPLFLSFTLLNLFFLHHLIFFFLFFFIPSFFVQPSTICIFCHSCLHCSHLLLSFFPAFFCCFLHSYSMFFPLMLLVYWPLFNLTLLPSFTFPFPHLSIGVPPFLCNAFIYLMSPIFHHFLLFLTYWSVLLSHCSLYSIHVPSSHESIHHQPWSIFPFAFFISALLLSSISAGLFTSTQPSAQPFWLLLDLFHPFLSITLTLSWSFLCFMSLIMASCSHPLHWVFLSCVYGLVVWQRKRGTKKDTERENQTFNVNLTFCTVSMRAQRQCTLSLSSLHTHMHPLNNNFAYWMRTQTGAEANYW